MSSGSCGECNEVFVSSLIRKLFAYGMRSRPRRVNLVSGPPFCEREFFRLSGETFDRIELSCCNVHGRGGSDGIQFLRTLKRLKFIGRFESEFFPHPVGHRESVIEGSSGVFSPECSVEFLHPVFDPASCVHSDNLF